MVSDKNKVIDTFSCFIRNKRFNLLSKNIYFDVEFSRLLDCFKDMKQLFESIQRRQNLAESLELGTSKFQRIELDRNRNISPELVYHFKDCSEEIKVVRVRREYFIFSTYPAFPSLNYREIPNCYGSFGSLDIAVDNWRRFVKKYLNRCYDELF